jgi:hypothetical protein
MTDATIGAGTAYSSGTSEFTSGVRWVLVAQSLVFCALLCRSLFVLFSLAIALSILPFTAFDYAFSIYKFLWHNTRSKSQVHWNSEQ